MHICVHAHIQSNSDWFNWNNSLHIYIISYYYYKLYYYLFKKNVCPPTTLMGWACAGAIPRPAGDGVGQDARLPAAPRHPRPRPPLRDLPQPPRPRPRPHKGAGPADWPGPPRLIPLHSGLSPSFVALKKRTVTLFFTDVICPIYFFGSFLVNRSCCCKWFSVRSFRPPEEQILHWSGLRLSMPKESPQVFINLVMFTGNEMFLSRSCIGVSDVIWFWNFI